MANILWTFQRQLNGLDPKLLLAIGLLTIATGVFALLGDWDSERYFLFCSVFIAAPPL